MKCTGILLKKCFFAVSVLVMLCSFSTKAKAQNYNGLDFSYIFDAEYYYDNNADLQEAFGYDEGALWNHFAYYGMSEGRQASENFDPQLYRSTYADLNEAFGDDFASYYIHYVQYGKSEGRIANVYSVLFDAQNYLNRYKDLRGAFGDDEKAALTHFINYGMSEGRQASNSFDVRAYRQANEDLDAAFGDNMEAYYFHYMNYGRYENRVTTDDSSIVVGSDNMEDTYAAVFDASYYLKNNGDVAVVYGYDSTKALLHFINCGMSEGRRAKREFNINYYKDNNPDLVEAFGDDNYAYYMHYISYGQYEGRAAYDPDEPVYYDLSEGALGIDVSSWQGEIDWEAVKNDGISFAIIRIGRGYDSAENNNQETGFDDIYATYNMDECERLGIPYGVYLYSYAVNTDQAYAEVEHIKRLLGGRNPRMGVYIDIESTKRYEDADIDVYSEDGRRLVTDLTKIILSGISNAGFKAGWYANLNYCRNVLYIDELSGYRWIAGYNNPDYEPEVREKGALMWQYTSGGSVNGISGDVDMDRLMQGISF